MPPQHSPELTLIEAAVLGLLIQRPRHGFAVAKEFGPDRRIGSIFTAQRPIVYRALHTLTAKGLVAEDGPPVSHSGRARNIRQPTPQGHRQFMDWVLTPVRHMRGVRVELLVKLALQDHLGIDSLPFLRSQYDVLAPIHRSIHAEPEIVSAGFDCIRASWRRESSDAVMRFLQRVIADGAAR